MSKFILGLTIGTLIGLATMFVLAQETTAINKCMPTGGLKQRIGELL